MTPRIFGVDVTFLAAGDVFRTGLHYAAQLLGVEYTSALWDNPELPRLVEDYAPDLILVIHGRGFSGQWRGRFDRYKKALWLVDEPYEVDSSTQYSPLFDYVFLNDTSTLHLHKDAHYLPTCYDPNMHKEVYAERIHKAGFIGGHNEERARYLKAAALGGHLSYVVGGPFPKKPLSSYWIAHNVPPSRTAELYQQTKVVINSWRLNHGRKGQRFNSRLIPAYSMNPRIYEALACGAMVVSEWRPEINKVFPDLPTFDTERELLNILEHLFFDEEYCAGLLFNCRERLQGHTYADRLAKVLKVCLGWEKEA